MTNTMNKLVDAQNEPIKQYLAGSDEKESIKNHLHGLY